MLSEYRFLFSFFCSRFWLTCVNFGCRLFLLLLRSDLASGICPSSWPLPVSLLPFWLVLQKRTSGDLLCSDLGSRQPAFVIFDKYDYSDLQAPALTHLDSLPRELISSSEKMEINGTRAFRGHFPERSPWGESGRVPLPHLTFRPGEEQRDVGAVLSGEDGHGLLPVLDVEPINLAKTKGLFQLISAQ